MRAAGKAPPRTRRCCPVPGKWGAGHLGRFRTSGNKFARSRLPRGGLGTAGELYHVQPSTSCPEFSCKFWRVRGKAGPRHLVLYLVLPFI